MAGGVQDSVHCHCGPLLTLSAACGPCRVVRRASQRGCTQQHGRRPLQSRSGRHSQSQSQPIPSHSTRQARVVHPLSSAGDLPCSLPGPCAGCVQAAEQTRTWTLDSTRPAQQRGRAEGAGDLASSWPLLDVNTGVLSSTHLQTCERVAQPQRPTQLHPRVQCPCVRSACAALHRAPLGVSPSCARAPKPRAAVRGNRTTCPRRSAVHLRCASMEDLIIHTFRQPRLPPKPPKAPQSTPNRPSHHGKFWQLSSREHSDYTGVAVMTETYLDGSRQHLP